MLADLREADKFGMLWTEVKMFTYLFVAAMLGHFVGDYILQNQWMATEKSYPGKRGHFACTVHVALYTAAVAVFTGIWSPLFLAAVFVPHWLIDRWSLAKYWLWLKNGYQMKDVWREAPHCAVPAPGAMELNVWKVAFAAPV